MCGGAGVTLKGGVEFVEEVPLFVTSLPFEHRVLLSLLNRRIILEEDTAEMMKTFVLGRGGGRSVLITSR